MKYLKWWKRKACNQEYIARLSFTEKSKALQTKAKRILQNQPSFTTNAKGTSLSGKDKATTRNKKITNGEAHW